MITDELTKELVEKLHAQMVFVHQRLTQTNQYYVDEFEIAKDSIATITQYCNRLFELKEANESKEPNNEPKEGN